MEEVPDKKVISKSELVDAIDNFDLFKAVWFSTIERNKSILKRRLCDGLSFERISAECGISVSQVKNIVYEGTNVLFEKYDLR